MEILFWNFSHQLQQKRWSVYFVTLSSGFSEKLSQGQLSTVGMLEKVTWGHNEAFGACA